VVAGSERSVTRPQPAVTCRRGAPDCRQGHCRCARRVRPRRVAVAVTTPLYAHVTVLVVRQGPDQLLAIASGRPGGETGNCSWRAVLLVHSQHTTVARLSNAQSLKPKSSNEVRRAAKATNRLARLCRSAWPRWSEPVTTARPEPAITSVGARHNTRGATKIGQSNSACHRRHVDRYRSSHCCYRPTAPQSPCQSSRPRLDVGGGPQSGTGGGVQRGRFSAGLDHRRRASWAMHAPTIGVQEVEPRV